MQIGYAIRRSTLKGAGKGLFATEHVAKGTMVWKYFEQNHKFFDNKEQLMNTINAFQSDDEKYEYLVHCYSLNKRVCYEYDDGHFWNHSTKANCSYMPEMDGGECINTYATRDIKKDEELFVDYDKEGFLDYPDWFLEEANKYGVLTSTNFDEKQTQEPLTKN